MQKQVLKVEVAAMGVLQPNALMGAVTYRFGDCQFDTGRRELRRAGQRIELQSKVYDCLFYLLSNHERSVGKDELQDMVWPGQVVTEAAIAQAVMKARKAIGDLGSSPRWIRTVHSRGYRFEGPVSVQPSPEGGADEDFAVCTSGPWIKPAIPAIRYARSGDVSIAYQIVGDGPFDLVYVHQWVSHLEFGWQQSRLANLYRRLSSFARLILFDKRGVGLSDRPPGVPTLEDRMDDLRAVMDAARSERAAVLAMCEGGLMSSLFAATYPERTLALALYGAYARRTSSANYPWPPDRSQRETWLSQVERNWGGGGHTVGMGSFVDWRRRLPAMVVHLPKNGGQSRFRNRHY